MTNHRGSDGIKHLTYTSEYIAEANAFSSAYASVNASVTRPLQMSLALSSFLIPFISCWYFVFGFRFSVFPYSPLLCLLQSNMALSAAKKKTSLFGYGVKEKN